MKKYLTLLLALGFLLSACAPTNTTPPTSQPQETTDAALNQQIQTLQQKITSLETEGQQLKDQIKQLEDNLAAQQEKFNQVAKSRPVAEIADQVLLILEKKDYASLAQFVSDKGVRFSPYSHVNPEKDVVLKAEDFNDPQALSKVRVWGVNDGKGDDISLNFNDYADRFIYDKNFLEAPFVGRNAFLGASNTINNILESYPEAKTLEYYFKGFDTQYEGMDWESLILVFEETADGYKLIGVIHNQWTI